MSLRSFFVFTRPLHLSNFHRSSYLNALTIVFISDLRYKSCGEEWRAIIHHVSPGFSHSPETWSEMPSRHSKLANWVSGKLGEMMDGYIWKQITCFVLPCVHGCDCKQRLKQQTGASCSGSGFWVSRRKQSRVIISVSQGCLFTYIQLSHSL